MRIIGQVFSAVAAISLTAAPVAAQSREATPVAESEQLGGGAWLLALLALVGVLALIDNADDAEYPNSP